MNDGEASTKRGANLRWADRVLASDLSAKAKYLGLVCALQWMDWATLANVRPGAPLAARVTGLSERTVKRAFAELCDTGFMKRVKRGSMGRASLYVGTWPKRTRDTKRDEDGEVEKLTSNAEADYDALANIKFEDGDYAGLTFEHVHTHEDGTYVKRFAAERKGTALGDAAAAYVAAHSRMWEEYIEKQSPRYG